MQSPNSNESSKFSLTNIPMKWLAAVLGILVISCLLLSLISILIVFITRAERDDETASLAPPPTRPATVVSTATTAPVATVTLAPANTEGRITAVRLSSAPLIDGDLVDWGAIPPFTASHIVAQKESWDGSMDVESIWRIGWDDQNLYLAVAVTDDVHVQTRETKFAYLGDSLELQFDTNVQVDYGSDVNSDDYQYVVSPGNFVDRSPGSFRFRGDAQGVMTDFIGSIARIAALKTAEGYNVEMAIPWSDLGIQPASNQILGAAFSLNDLDTPGTAVQELMLSHVATRRWLDPSSWGSLELEP
ncbi:MAG: hypothetical protein GY796_26780 [Chloroflexi bacterium]|nr:hypothetical protein [Chloroflexota bacterium]